MRNVYIFNTWPRIIKVHITDPRFRIRQICENYFQKNNKPLAICEKLCSGSKFEINIIYGSHFREHFLIR